MDEAAGPVHPRQPPIEDVVAQKRPCVVGDRGAKPSLYQALLQVAERQPGLDRKGTALLDRTPPGDILPRGLVMVDVERDGLKRERFPGIGQAQHEERLRAAAPEPLPQLAVHRSKVDRQLDAPELPRDFPAGVDLVRVPGTESGDENVHGMNIALKKPAVLLRNNLPVEFVDSARSLFRMTRVRGSRHCNLETHNRAAGTSTGDDSADSVPALRKDDDPMHGKRGRSVSDLPALWMRHRGEGVHR